MKKELLAFLKKEVPGVTFDVSHKNGRYRVVYYGGDQVYSDQVRQAVADFLGQPKPSVIFRLPHDEGVIELDWHPEGKPSVRVVYSDIICTERVNVPLACGHVQILRVHLSCGHYVDTPVTRRKTYASEIGKLKRKMCWRCVAVQNDRAQREHYEFLEKIGIIKETT